MVIYVYKLDRSIDFYSGLLGLEVTLYREQDAALLVGSFGAHCAADAARGGGVRWGEGPVRDLDVRLFESSSNGLSVGLKNTAASAIAIATRE